MFSIFIPFNSSRHLILFSGKSLFPHFHFSRLTFSCFCEIRVDESVPSSVPTQPVCSRLTLVVSLFVKVNKNERLMVIALADALLWSFHSSFRRGENQLFGSRLFLVWKWPEEISVKEVGQLLIEYTLQACVLSIDWLIDWSTIPCFSVFAVFSQGYDSEETGGGREEDPTGRARGQQRTDSGGASTTRWRGSAKETGGQADRRRCQEVKSIVITE